MRDISTTHAQLGARDYGVVIGRGVTSHPDGPSGGGRSIRQAWDAARSGIEISEAAGAHPQLAAALRAH